MGKACRNIPYINHRNIPILKQISMTNETSFADFDRHVFSICGKKENVVNVAATNPNMLIQFMEMQPL
jgi:hypothetical protein